MCGIMCARFLLAVVTLSSIGLPTAQSELELVQDAATCELSLSDATAGQNISVTCQRTCAEARIPEAEKYIIGTDIYHWTSDPCLSAIHAARLRYPRHWPAVSEAIQLSVLEVTDVTLPSTFRAGLKSRSLNLQPAARPVIGFRILTPMAQELIPDITTVHSKFRFEEGTEFTSVECHVGDSEGLNSVGLFSTTGQEVQFLTEKVQDERGSYVSVAWYLFGHFPRSIICRQRDSIFSDVTSIEYIENPFYEPSHLVSRAGAGEKATLAVKKHQLPLEPSWTKDGLGLEYNGNELQFEESQRRDAGIYGVTYGGQRRGGSIMRLIVRGCRSGRFGPQCERRCPYCLHGGQCHSVTGECICPAGFNGTRCHTSCPEGFFGRSCGSQCASGSCQGRLLCVSDPQGCTCPPGWTGKACSQGCPLGTYGPDCAFTCGRCAQPGVVCDRFTGACPSGCQGTSAVLPPLCLSLWPWFRDPPSLVRVTFKSVTISHPAWDATYDNGYGTDNLRYIVQFKVLGEKEWQRPHRGATVDKVPAGENVQFTLENLAIDTSYAVRIIIRDRSRRATMDDEDKVPIINVTTECEGPGKVKILDSLENIDTEITQIRLELENTGTTCPPTHLVHSFVETATARKGRSLVMASSEDGSATLELSDLQPYTQYTFSVTAGNRKADGPTTTVQFRTAEQAPSKPLSVSVSAEDDDEAVIIWRPPASPNGIVRYYSVIVKHIKYRACGDESRPDESDFTTYNTSSTSVTVPLQHAFSLYSVEVQAVTVAPGPSAEETFHSNTQPPVAGPLSTEVTAAATALTLGWKRPDCATWNDFQSNLKLRVLYRRSEDSVSTHSSIFRSLSPSVTDLSPFTTYLLKVYLENRAGRHGTAVSLRATTLEAAPSRVESLASSEVTPVEFLISWAPPTSPNGIIRQYHLSVQHVRYRACGGSSKDGTDITTYNTSSTSVTVPLQHAFSLYSVEVQAVTVAPGPSAEETFSTAPLAPSTGVTISRMEPKRRRFDLFWKRPHCSTWNDARQNIVMFVEIVGLSPWDHGSETRNISTSPATLDALTPYSDYAVRAFLGNSVGISPTPVLRNGSTEQSLPGPPREVAILTVSSTSVTIGWEQPLPPLSRITGYRVLYRRAGTDLYSTLNSQTQTVCTEEIQARTCTLTVADLTENVKYMFEVSAYGYDVGGYGPSVRVNGTTKEGVPGPPESLRSDNFSRTALELSWLEPIERNGVIIEFQLNVTYPAPSSKNDTSMPNFFRTHRIPSKGKEGGSYHHIQNELSPGRRYLVSVAARTSAGFGPSTSRLLETAVAPPQVAPPVTVDTSQVTDSTVPTQLPTVTGEAVSHYYTVVSTDAGFDGSVLTADHLPSSDEARQLNLNYYVAAVLEKVDVERNNSFVFGDGRYYKGAGRSYYNQPLTKGITYKLGTVVAAGLSEGNQEFTYKAFPELVTVETPSDTGLIAGIVLGVLIAMAAAVMAGLVYRRRELRAREPETKNTSDDLMIAPFTTNVERLPEETYFDPAAQQMTSECIYENLQLGQINMTRIAVSDLTLTLRRDVETGRLKQQLLSLPAGMSRPCDYGRNIHNRAKNRYGNLIAYDDSRVVLEKTAGDEYSDYINASYIDGYKRPSAYIATQGPKPETVFDFWRMVWQQRAKRIVMLTNLVEGAKRKCDLYWPQDTSLELPGMCVTKENQQDSSDFVVRVFCIVKDGEQRMVTHLHYTAWPDHSVPLYPHSLAKFMRVLDSIPDDEAPTIVHCSAGVGRTGTVILIDTLYKMGRQEQAVDPYSHLTVARRQRANMCANYEQYRLVHEVLVELLVAPDSSVPAAQLAARLPQLRSAAAGPSQLEQQLAYLDANPPPASFSSALSENLEGKNRSSQILPENKSRVFLHGAGRDSYINAIYVAGYRRPDGFIATEAPLPGRQAVFWQMVVQKHSQVIVVINDISPEEVFWPQLGEDLIYGNLQISLKKSSSTSLPPCTNVTCLEIQLKAFNRDKSVTSTSLKLYALAVDNVAGGLPSGQDLAQLYIAFKRSLPSGDTGPTVVVCSTGVRGCGVFLASTFVMARLAEEQEVDVLQAVALVRRSRPQFVSTLAQYDLCYSVALAWLEAFDTYANFQ